jgi:hypothetical protein
MRKIFKISLIVASLCLSASAAQAQTWKMGKAPLMTPYAATIDTANVLGEYPRPQMAREKWLNLNGIWQFQPGVSLTEAQPKGTLSAKILVPFPVESAISGVMKHHDKMWYRRTFTVPADWKGQRLLVHFGAVDYECEVFVNKQLVGTHRGGYDPFSFDITSKIKGRGKQEITVHVSDPTDNGGQPRGKQTLHQGGIMYTPTSGVWQTVWLEPLPQTAISDIKLVPNVDNSTLALKAFTSGAATGLTVAVEVKDGAKTVTTFAGNANADLVIPIPNAKLWSPNSPFLYDLKITLKSEGKDIDNLTSYFGMRKISMAQVGEYKKMMLNNEFLFQFGPLDQGFWPDGLYTAPTDLAIQNDLKKNKEFGFNMIRKHIKVEPYRWYYWADKLGILVWQDMPSPNSYTDHPQPIDEAAYKSELETMVKTHWNSPCIVSWVVFNESQAQHNTKALVDDVIALDPNRLVNQASGGSYFDAGHILDAHSYPPPACPTSSSQILVCGEYGGIGYVVPKHIWKDGPTYVMINSADELLDMYKSFAEQLMQFKTNNGLSAAVYTELTDVESELNGLMTYDRVVKADINKLFEINQRVINKNSYLTEILPTSLKDARNWKYTTSEPTSNWYTAAFDDSKWKQAEGGFGSGGTPGGNIRTNWNTSDIWMRQQFNPGNLTAELSDSLVLLVHHDENCEIYINDVLACKLSGYTSGYVSVSISNEAKKVLVPNSLNTISMHCHQTEGGQYIDAGISMRSYTKQLEPLAKQIPAIQEVIQQKVISTKKTKKK